jgi:2-iminobutanoate/2-iminopropanoate deaminase
MPMRVPRKTLALGLLALLAGCASSRKITEYHLGPWEKDIGYSQAIRVGNRLIVAGTIGAAPDARDMESQMRNAYQAIEKTLHAHGVSFNNVVSEHIHTTDMDALIRCQETRKKIYGGRLPAATWVQIERLYVKEALLEIEVEAVL